MRKKMMTETTLRKIKFITKSVKYTVSHSIITRNVMKFLKIPSCIGIKAKTKKYMPSKK